MLDVSRRVEIFFVKDNAGNQLALGAAITILPQLGKKPALFYCTIRTVYRYGRSDTRSCPEYFCSVSVPILFSRC
jgi:hypothetical protein